MDKISKYRIFLWLTLVYSLGDLVHSVIDKKWLLLPVPTLVFALAVLTIVDDDDA